MTDFGPSLHAADELRMGGSGIAGVPPVRLYRSVQIDTVRLASVPLRRYDTAMPTNTIQAATGIGYLRVSTQDQADSGLGLDAQRAAIESWSAKNGVPIVAWFQDQGVSGSVPMGERTAGGMAVAAVRRGMQLVVAKRDRLGRDSLQVQLVERELQKRGARLVSAAGEGTEADDPTSVFLRRTLDAVGELERGMIRARTRAALHEKAKRGERFTRHAPTGFRWEGDRLQADDAELRVLAAVAEAMACGCGMSLRCIAAKLEEQGLTSRSGKAFTATAVRRMQARLAAGSWLQAVVRPSADEVLQHAATLVAGVSEKQIEDSRDKVAA